MPHVPLRLLRLPRALAVCRATRSDGDGGGTGFATPGADGALSAAGVMVMAAALTNGKC